MQTFIGLKETIEETSMGILHAAPNIVQRGIEKQQETLIVDRQQTRETNGVRWELQSVIARNVPVTRWFSPDFKTESGFLFLSQRILGQQPGWGLLASIGKTLFRASISLYGFKPDITPDLSCIDTLSPLEFSLEPHFTAFTCDSDVARKILNPRVIMPLRNWAERYPMRQLQQGRFGQLIILFCHNGVYLATLNVLQPDQVDELTVLGVELVKAQVGES